MFTALNSEKMLSVPIIDTGLKTPGKCSEPITRINPAAMLAVIDKISFSCYLLHQYSITLDCEFYEVKKQGKIRGFSYGSF